MVRDEIIELTLYWDLDDKTYYLQYDRLMFTSDATYITSPNLIQRLSQIISQAVAEYHSSIRRANK